MTEEGFKTCPACGASVAEWHSRCECGHQFFARKASAPGGSSASSPPMNEWVIDERGRRVRHVPMPEHKGKKKRKGAAVPALATGDAKVVEKVIERQVVVTRCKYCETYTPVELPQCKSCGATL